jgi:hypothetical protein
MSQPFRKVRLASLSSLTESKAGIYIVYGIGEVVLLVMGILIALTINNWNENRKERKREQQILVQLKSDYQENLAQLCQKIEIRKKIIAAGYRLLEFTDNPETVSADSLYAKLYWMQTDPTFDPIKDDILGSSNLRLISNDRLRQLLSNWTSEVSQVQEIELAWQKMRNENVFDFMVENRLARNTQNYIWKNGHIPVHALDKQQATVLKFNQSPVAADLQQILKDSNLESIATYAITLNHVCNLQSAVLEKRIREILQLIERDLEKVE